MKGTDSVQPLQLPPIAIIGMAGIFPQAHNLREYWQNILNKIDCITDVPASRWEIDDYYDPDPTAPDKTYCKRGGFLPDIDFDPLEFGLPPNILEVTDVSQLLGLVVAREALQDAGYPEQREFNRARTGCILGVGGGQKLVAPLMSRLQYPVWEKVLRSSGVPEAELGPIIEKMKLAYVRWEENSFPGLLGNVIAGRITNRLNLGGTNCVVDAACASSLAAMKMAISELIERRCDMMITGGVDTDNSIFMYMCFSKTPAFSRGDKPRPFDKAADGMMVGEGLGMLVLKRLEDAERDGDRIYAVIRGIGTSSDGRHKSIYNPHATGQARALRDAYASAGFEPHTVGLIEAHGTGTVAGDLTEFTSLKTVFSENGTPQQQIALGSVKSQIGHTKAAAGAVSMIKAVLALHHKVLPATINVTEPNPKFEVGDSPFYVNTETRPWIRAEGAPPRRAGVSSFGFGGTNFHVVLEEYTSDHQHAYRLNDTNRQVVLHAATPTALLAQLQQQAASLSGASTIHNYYALTASPTDPAIPQEHARVGFVASSPAEAYELLLLAASLIEKQPDSAEWQHPRGISYRRHGMPTAGTVVALFSGQGSQYLDMGRELALHYPPLRQMLGALDSLFIQAGKQPLSTVIFPPPAFTEEQREKQARMLQRTDYAQPAIGVLSATLYRLARRAGLQPSFMAGHSFGELTALWAAGAINDGDFLRLMKARGEAMMPLDHATFDAGSMLAVSGDLVMERLQEDIRPFAGLQIANWNSPRQVVLAGSTAAVQAAYPVLQSKGYACVPLPVAAAFHTPLVGHAQQPFAQAVAQAQCSSPQVAVYANATGQRYPHDAAQVQQMLAQQMLQPVLFQRQIETIYNDGGRIFVEFGPRSVLTNLVRDILGHRDYLAVSLNDSRKKDSDRQLQDGLVQLRVAGVPLRPTDGYYLPEEVPAMPRKGLKIALNGSNYVSAKTRKAFSDALQQQGTMTMHPFDAQATAAPEPPEAPQPVTSPTLLDRSLHQFTAHQQDVLRLHEQYLTQQQQMSQSIAALVEQQQQLIANGSLPASVVQQLIKSVEMLRAHQSETLRVHEQYLQRQNEYARNLLELVHTAPTPAVEPVVAPAEAAAPAPAALEPQAVPAAPEPAAVPAAPEPVTPPAPPAFAFSFDSLFGELAPAPAAMTPVIPAAPTPQPAAPVVQAAPAPAPVAPVVHTNGNGVAANDLTTALLAIVADKTGYPAEMLDPAMDLEADLGIDSIKRVEILGALQDQFPALPRLSPDDLGELRSLGQIVAVLHGTTQAPPPVVQAAPAAVVSLPPLPALDTPIQRTAAAIRTLPPADMLEYALPAKMVCLITSDGTPLTTRLVQSLSERGWRVVVLHLSPTLVPTAASIPADIAQVSLSNTDEQHLTDTLRQISSSHGAIGSFIHLHPQIRAAGQMFAETDKLLVRHIFLLARHLKNSLSDAARQGAGRFITVTRLDGAFGLEQQGDFSVVGGGLFGLTKTLNLEWPSVVCRALDISPQLDTNQTVAAILNELYDPNRLITEVGYGIHGRVTLHDGKELAH